MATIKEMLGPDEAEKLRAKVVLGADPMHLNRTRFEAYLRAKSSLMYNTLEPVLGHDPTISLIETEIYTLDGKWREEAKRINMARHAS